MGKLTLTGLALVSAACAFAADFPEGSGAIEITEAGTYTASSDRTIGSLTIATPTGTFDERTTTVIDHTAVPTRTITFNGSDPQFNVSNHFNTVWMKGGIWNFSGIFRLGTDSSNTAGKDAFRTLYLTDGAQVSGVTRVYISYYQGGSELHVSNATLSAENMWVQGAAAMVSSAYYGASDVGRGKLIVEANGKVNLTDALNVQAEYTSSNSRKTGLARISGSGAELTAKGIYLGNTPNTRAEIGSQMFVEDGASVTSTGSICLGVKPYAYDPKLFDTFQVSDSTFAGVNFYCGYGENVVNEQAVISNSTFSATSDVCCGYGANAATNSLVFKDCTDKLTFGKNVSAGYGEGSHDNFIGFYNCGTVEIPAGCSWYAGKGENACGNTFLVSNTVIRTNRELASGAVSTASNNLVVVAGPSARLEMTYKQRDLFYYGHHNRFLLTDYATLAVDQTSLWLFKNTYDSECIIEKGAQLTRLGTDTLSLTLGRYTVANGVRSGNTLTVRDGGSVDIPYTLSIGGTNNTLIVDNAVASVGSTVTVGLYQSDSTEGTAYPADGCRLVVRGKSPKLNLSKHFDFPDGARSVLRFEVPAGGYSWSDEPTRAAPIVLSANTSYHMKICDDTVLEADVSALESADWDKPIALVSSVGTITMSETALAAANARGMEAGKQYVFFLSDDKKTLYLKRVTRGMLFSVR